jgi:hypothetical protein
MYLRALNMTDDDAAEAIGKASAAISIQAALIARLLAKRILTAEEVVTLTGDASIRLESMNLAEDAKTMADAALRGIATMWTLIVPKN